MAHCSREGILYFFGRCFFLSFHPCLLFSNDFLPSSSVREGRGNAIHLHALWESLYNVVYIYVRIENQRKRSGAYRSCVATTYDLTTCMWTVIRAPLLLILAMIDYWDLVIISTSVIVYVTSSRNYVYGSSYYFSNEINMFSYFYHIGDTFRQVPIF